MTDKIGVLGEVLDATGSRTAANHVVYTVPAGKAAKFQIMWKGEAHATTSNGDLQIIVNGTIVAHRVNIPTTEIMWSSSVQMVEDTSASLDPDGTTLVQTCAPAPQVYYLSAADIVSYTIVTDAFVAMEMMVVGTEIDV
jgi:hypothetical protein